VTGSRDRTLLGVAEVAEERLDDWRWMLRALHARFATGDFATGLRLVDEVAAAAERADHHPDLDLRYGSVSVRLSSHDVRGVTSRDVSLAREVSAAAARLGVRAEPERVLVVELALDMASAAEIAPFWAAVLGHPTPFPDVTDLVDPEGRLPPVWFQDARAEPAGPQRWHLDVNVAPETVERRVRDAIDAGGVLVSDANAPAFWVLADSQGNHACLCTALGRTGDA
jgi:4a-hydroxytetrahydrobiopterin dehydratase